MELVAHRILWSLPMILGYALLTGRGGRLLEVARTPRALGMLCLTTCLVATNWFVFIYSIQIGKTSEMSFGYYIYPLIALLLGRMVFGERITLLQGAAAVMAGMAVLWLALRFDAPPWLALLLAMTFAAYGTLRKLIETGPLVGVVWEFMIISLPLLAYLIWQGGGVFGQDAWQSALLIGTAFLTGIPLVLFVEAARRLQFSTSGVLFYINPTLQFVCAILLGEAFGFDRLIAFGLIWVAVALYCFELRRPS